MNRSLTRTWRALLAAVLATVLVAAHAGATQLERDDPSGGGSPGESAPVKGEQAKGDGGVAEVEPAPWPWPGPKEGEHGEGVGVHPDYEVLKDPRFHPPPPPPCPNGQVGDATMPDPMTTGALFTPGTDSFVGLMPAGAGRPVYYEGTGTPSGTGVDPAPEFRIGNDGNEELRVQAHFWHDWINGPQLAMARVTIESLTGSTTRQYPFWTIAGGFKPQFNCYADDTQAGSNRFYFDWWIPVSPEIVAEPGFNVRFEVVSFNGATLHNADQNTVHVGPEPTALGTNVNNAVGVAVDNDALIDTNGVPDDLESVLRAEFGPVINTAFNGLDNTAISLGGNKHFTIKNVWGSVNADLDLVPTKTGSTTVTPDPIDVTFNPTILPFDKVKLHFPFSPVTVPSGPDDDEHRLWVTGTLNNAHLDGILEVPPLGADWTIEGDIDLTVSVAINIDGTLTSDIRLEDLSIDVTHKSIDIWQWFYDLVVNENKIFNVIVKLLEEEAGPIAQELLGGSLGATLQSTVDGIIATQLANLDGVLGGGVAVGGGGFGLMPLTFKDTCPPLGCDGFRAGDVLLWNRGLDLMVDTGATNLGPDRFPHTYDPTTGDIADAVHGRTTNTGGAFDLGVHVDAALLNQVLTALGDSGLLDASANLAGVGLTTSPEVAPLFVPTESLGITVPGDPPLMLFLPNLQVGLDNGARFAVDVIAGVDASVDLATGALIPAAQVALNINVLRCPGGELLCGLLSSTPLLDAFEQFVNNELIGPLLESSLGQVAIPHVAKLQLGSAHIAQNDGNLSIWADVVPTARVNVNITPNWSGYPDFQLESVTVKATPQYFPGSGPYSVNWSVKNASGNTVYSSPSGGEPNTTITIDVDDFPPESNGQELYIQVQADATVTRGGVSASDSDSEWYWWLDPDGPCPPMC